MKQPTFCVHTMDFVPAHKQIN